jgi:hypothetical protein
MWSLSEGGKTQKGEKEGVDFIAKEYEIERTLWGLRIV